MRSFDPHGYFPRVFPDGTPLSRRIRWIRGRRTQEQYARDLGVSPGAVSKWENGETRPSTQNLRRIAERGQVGTDALLGLETQRGVHEGTWQEFLDRHGDELSEAEQMTLATVRFHPPLDPPVEVYVAMWAALRLADGCQPPR
jgi:transcriptional regulator with XRE-family HTH domain